MNLLNRLDRLPPFLVRAMARKNGHYPTHKYLAAQIGWSERKFRTVAYKSSWASVPVGDMLSFAHACGIDLGNQYRAGLKLRSLVRNKFKHLSVAQLAALLKRLSELPPEHPARPEHRR